MAENQSPLQLGIDAGINPLTHKRGKGKFEKLKRIVDTLLMSERIESGTLSDGKHGYIIRSAA